VRPVKRSFDNCSFQISRSIVAVLYSILNSPFVFASWPSSFSSFLVACISEPYPRSYLKRLTPSCDEPLVRQSLSSNGADKAIKAIPSVPLHVAVIQTKREFINISSHVLFTRVMIDTVKSSLEDCEYALDSVCCDAFFGVLAFQMIHGFMLKGFSSPPILPELIRMDS
jgi:hypothetical protein